MHTYGEFIFNARMKRKNSKDENGYLSVESFYIANETYCVLLRLISILVNWDGIKVAITIKCKETNTKRINIATFSNRQCVNVCVNQNINLEFEYKISINVLQIISQNVIFYSTKMFDNNFDK